MKLMTSRGGARPATASATRLYDPGDDRRLSPAATLHGNLWLVGRRRPVALHRHVLARGLRRRLRAGSTISPGASRAAGITRVTGAHHRRRERASTRIRTAPFWKRRLLARLPADLGADGERGPVEFGAPATAPIRPHAARLFQRRADRRRRDRRRPPRRTPGTRRRRHVVGGRALAGDVTARASDGPGLGQLLRRGADQGPRGPRADSAARPPTACTTIRNATSTTWASPWPARDLCDGSGLSTGDRLSAAPDRSGCCDARPAWPYGWSTAPPCRWPA